MISPFPFYKQLDSMDCGPTCLRMIAKWYGKTYSLPLLREKCYIDKAGVSLKGISEAAEQIINNLTSGIDKWSDNYIIRAELSGELFLPSTIVTNSYIKSNTVIASIIPSDVPQQRQAQVKINNQGIGKIKANDKVIIKIDGYPYKEFGTIQATIGQISLLPEIITNSTGEQQHIYTIDIPLPDTMMSSYGIEIPFRPNSSLTTEIITEDKSLLARLFETVISLIQQV